MKNAIILLILIIVAVSAVQYYNREPAITPSGKTIKVGFIGEFGGEALAQGRETLEGVLTANELEPLLDDGDELVIVAVEQGSTSNDTIKAIEKMVIEDQVVAILLGSASQRALTLKGVIDALQIPVIALIATHPDITVDSNHMNQLSFDDTMQGQVAALFIRDELYINRAAVIVDQQEHHSSHLAQTFRTKFESANGVITGFHTISRIDTNHLQAMKDSGTQIMYLPVNALNVIKIRSLLDELEWSPEIMLSDGLLATMQTQYPEHIDALNGAYKTDLFAGEDEFSPRKLLLARINTGFHSLFRGNPTTYTALGIEGYAILLNAINRCGELKSSNCINSSIRSTDKFKGLMSKISIGKDGKAIRPVYINRVKNGASRSLVKVY